jgi:serine phosphatase RsbU (regulator of sigma subunit)
MPSTLNSINRFWKRASRIGLRDDEGVLGHREVIFMNRVLLIIPVLMVFYIPVELAINGTGAIHMVVIFIAGLMLPLLFNKYRLFGFSRYYCFLIGVFFITGASISVGKGVYNYVALITMVLLGIILFRSTAERVISLLMVIGAYLIILHLIETVPPRIVLSEQVKPQLAATFFILSIVINFLLGYYLLGVNNEYEALVVTQREQLREKNKEITDSITYAKRIQSSILPSEKLMREHLPGHFVLYLPKDIVAGDFYWLEAVGGKVIFAVADCTGHGVPGALVSVICHNALNRSVREFALTEPAAILDKTREIVVAEFGKSDEHIRDGMDVSICVLDKATGVLEWAGANNPLIMVNSSGLTEARPDKQPVSSFEQAKPFTSQRFQLSPGDMLYLFSDGFSDQFGGPKGKKFKYSALKDLLKTVSNLPVDAQKARISNAFAEWKRNLDQVDDVCVMGLRV